MIKKLFSWLFGKDEETSREVRVFDFVERGPGNDITLRIIDDGNYAEAVVFLDMGADVPEVGDFIVVDLSDQADLEESINTFVVDSAITVSLGVSKLTMSRYEGAENE